jgi:Tfp pilus assembly protein PilN
MKNIDFLPVSYRERLRLKQARVWWGIVAATFGTAIAASACAQWSLARSLQYQLATAGTAATVASAQDKRYATLLTEVNQGSDLAALCVYLKHPWPRTQILASLVTPLPETVRLMDVRIRQEAPSGVALAQQAPRKPGDGKTDSAKPGPAADLSRLREENDQLVTVVEITGETSDADALHRYVAALGKSQLLHGARLKSFEAVEARDLATIRFELRAQVSPAYGVAGGPEGHPSQSAEAAPAPAASTSGEEGPTI